MTYFGIELHSATANLNAPILYTADGTQGPGTLAILDFSRADCWAGDSGVSPVNLAADTATTLTGNACTPTFGGKLANISLASNMLSLGIEKARMEFPAALTTYCIGKQISFTAFMRFCQGTVTQWTAGAAVAVGDQIYNGNLIWTATVAGNLGATAPTHTSSTAANGTATLAAGVVTGASTYGFLTPGGFFGLNTSAYPHDYDIFGAGAQTFSDFSTASINQAKVNAISAAPGYAAVNGSVGATGAQITGTPTTALGLGIENFSAGTGYDATAGTSPQNLVAPKLQLARLEIHDLSVNGLTAAQQYAQSRAYFAAYHPAASLLA